jgi:hypothetical protein
MFIILCLFAGKIPKVEILLYNFPNISKHQNIKIYKYGHYYDLCNFCYFAYIYTLV